MKWQHSLIANLACSSWRANLNEEAGIVLRVLLPWTWDVIFVINSFDRADRLASTTVNALIRLDIEHASAFVDAIYWALFNARLVLNIDTGFGNYVGHVIPLAFTNSG